MLYLRENPQGIDQRIEIIQKAIYSKLGWKDIVVFGRIYRNPKDKGYTPEAYIKDGEYKDVLTNDLKSGTMFFIESESHTPIMGNDFETELKIVFMLDLKKLSGSQIRNDVEVQNNALLEVKKNRFITITKLEKGIETVFKGFDTSNIKLNDMQPYHVFAIVGKLKYSINNNC